ncbi:MAG: 50S ribosomal protein L4 [Candidatus Magasanikbacteria bacterium]|nr:50S ribosomal protein L4 [Candidatus Magasanikbacteria bacterium]
MNSLKIYNQQGEVIGTKELSAAVFGIKPKQALIAEVVRSLFANRRQVLADTKKKGEVRGGGRKPWAQKGTGRARAGSIRSPLWRGGGITFGPTSERNFKLKINKKVKRLAMCMVLSDKAQNNGLILVDSLAVENAKTKLVAGFLKKLPLHKGKILVIMPASDTLVARSARNINNVQVIARDQIDIITLLNHANVVTMPGTIESLEKTYGVKSK